MTPVAGRYPAQLELPQCGILSDTSRAVVGWAVDLKSCPPKGTRRPAGRLPRAAENCADTLTKGYDTTHARVKDFSRLARICHGFRHDTPRDIGKSAKHPEWQPSDPVL
jgi:hypothetical protein